MGVLRLFLALSVVAAHAQSPVFALPAAAADVAVNLFFVISGFYMAMVLNGKYRAASLRAFYLNRIIRLFPVYFIGTLIALIVTFGAVSAFVGSLEGWGPLYYVLTNTFIVGQDLSYLLCVPTGDGCSPPVPLTLNPPAWSLSIELGFYAVAPFIVRSPRRTYLFIAVGIVYLVSTTLVLPSVFLPTAVVPHLAPQGPVDFDYYFYPASFLYFGLGALARQISTGQARFRYWPILLLVAGAAVAPLSMEFWQPFLFAAVVPVLFRLTADNRIDRVIGELSYPVYILHFPTIDTMRAVLPADSWALTPFWYGSVVGSICVVAGLVVHFTVESAATRFRHSLIKPEVVRPEKGVLADRRGEATPGPSRRVVARLVLSAYFLVPVLLMMWVLSQQVAAPAA